MGVTRKPFLYTEEMKSLTNIIFRPMVIVHIIKVITRLKITLNDNS